MSGEPILDENGHDTGITLSVTNNRQGPTIIGLYSNGETVAEFWIEPDQDGDVDLKATVYAEGFSANGSEHGWTIGRVQPSEES